ncbi:BREX system serine/threonine kinase PglW [Streptomyces sp. NPDC052020]|uniref:BREX system serine/threonine kinase PglW n=1 Tax=Streptomyces sp. NPDC052020 TaxID=3155677 RepID=UPI00342643E6
MEKDRWTTVTESEFGHEKRGLESIRKQLPGNEPWRAWANFTFTANSGHPRECDLLIVAPGGVWLVELKDWVGHLAAPYGTWVQTKGNGEEVDHGNPLHLLNKKAKELATLLNRAGGPKGQKVWVQEAVCITNPKLRVELPQNERQHVFTIAELIKELRRPPRDERFRYTEGRSLDIAKRLKKAGIRASEAERWVGSYRLDNEIASGPTWVDYVGHHKDLYETVRVRVYLRERGASAEARESVERAARREAAVLSRFKHRGAAQYKTFEPSAHPAGPALLFDYDMRAMRLDEYVRRYGDKLDIQARLRLLRQLAETIRSAHSGLLHHRALAARSVDVIPGPRKLGEEEAWLRPRLEIADWQVASARSLGSSSGARAAAALAPTALSATHVAEGAEPYLAPELTAPRPDPVLLDVYGLGTLAYLLVTGRPPASTQAEVLTMLRESDGLTPSAVVDGMTDDVDLLVQAATAYRPEQRMSSVDEFLELLADAEDSVGVRRAQPAEPATPAEPANAPSAQPEPDALEAQPGDVLGGGRWQVRRRLGTGSTSRAFLVRDLRSEEFRTRPLAVLKVAVSDRSVTVLEGEAQVMRRLRADSRVINLVVPEPLRLGERTALAVEYVGDEKAELADGEGSNGKIRAREETLARWLREYGAMGMETLEKYGDQLFGAVDFLQGEGVWHRDIKPDNIAIRKRPNGTRELVLIDFSLASYPASETAVGTQGYMDPFIGGTVNRRAVYDDQAERYALAVTLHQMASGELPRWGDGSVTPEMTDPKEMPYPEIQQDAFEDPVREGLLGFFRRALHRDAGKRFATLKDMQDAWKKVFLDASQQTVPSSHGKGHGAEEELHSDEARDQRAAAAGLDTHLSLSGLTAAAQSFLYGLDITTVGELLDRSERDLINKPGLGAKTRSDIQRRIREWRRRLRAAELNPLTGEGRKAAKAELDAAKAESGMERKLSDHLALAAGEGPALRRVSLDALATRMVPELVKGQRGPVGNNQSRIDVARALLRLPGDDGRLPALPAWPTQTDVAKLLGMTQGGVNPHIKGLREKWRDEPALRELRAEVLDILEQSGRLASAAEIADALILRRGTDLPKLYQRRALALAAVRVVVEMEEAAATPAFQHRPNRQAVDEALRPGLLALECREDVDSPDTPSAPGLLDYASRLGQHADRLVRAETLPTAASVLADLTQVEPPQGALDWDERRIVDIAAAASQDAAVSSRLELYPRGLGMVRALRLTQAGVVKIIPGLSEDEQPGLTVATVHERVRSRFPELRTGQGEDGHGLPTDVPLTEVLKEAGFPLVLRTHKDGRQRYLPEGLENASHFGTGIDGSSTVTSSAAAWSENADLAAAARAEERLRAAASGDGYRVLTVRSELGRRAMRELADARFGGGVVTVSATEVFLRHLHAEQEAKAAANAKGLPRWETILKADAAEAGSTAAVNFTRFARNASDRMREEISTLLCGGDDSRPLLLTDGAVFARYDYMGGLDELARQAREGEAQRPLWLFVPQADPGRPPVLGRAVGADGVRDVYATYQEPLGEWIPLPESWVKRIHLAGAQSESAEQTENTEEYAR